MDRMNVLMLHDIRDFNPRYFPKRYELPYFITRIQLQRIINNLKDSSCSILSLSEDFIIDNNSIVGNLNIFTFDDGLKDHLEVARTLANQNIKGYFFVPSGPILERSIIDSHKIQFILASVEPNKIISFIVKSFRHFFNLPHELLDNYYVSRWSNNIWTREMVFVTRILREYPNKAWRTQIINDLFYKYVSSDPKSFADDFYLSYEDVLEIKSLGHLIGGHGHYSYDLRFESAETIEMEILKMNSFLTNLNEDVKYYAYANGGYDDFVIDLLKKYNFDLAFTTKHLPVESLNYPFELPRIDATKSDLIF